MRAMPPALPLLPPPPVRWATPRCWVASLVGAASQVESRGVQREPWAQTPPAAEVVVVGDQTEPRGEWVPLGIAWWGERDPGFLAAADGGLPRGPILKIRGPTGLMNLLYRH